MSKIRVLIVDDQKLIRDGLKALLELEEGIEVSGEASNGEEAVLKYINLKPDVVLMDIQMPGMDGVEAIRKLHSIDENVKVIILTTFDNDEYIFEGLRAGALGYLLKDISGEEIAKAIRIVVSGGVLITPSIARKVVTEFSRLEKPARNFDKGISEPLTEREKEILSLIAKGLSNSEIATKLFLSTGTVKNYLTNIFQKIGVRDRTQAAIYAKERGLL